MKFRLPLPPSLCPLVYVACVIFMVSLFLSYKVPIYGFAWLPCFGEQFEPRMTSHFRDTSGYIATRFVGHDGQFYAQLAVDPLILNPDTKAAFDNFQFRARRPLFAMTAHLAGGGEPRAVLQAYAIQNIVFWLALAGILLRWLPPTCWQNTLRYVSILYSVGLVDSIQLALLDGPAMTMMAFAVLLADLAKPWFSAIVLGFAGLGKETSILALSIFGGPKSLEPKQLFYFGLKLTLGLLPLIGWLFYLSQIDTDANSDPFGNISNFGWPFVGWWTAVEALHTNIIAGQGLNRTLVTTGFLFAMPLQAVALIAIWKPANLWWRVGSAFAVLSFFLGYATWEGLVGTAARICLPMTVAFNILVPRTSKWMVILLVGNLTTVIGFFFLIKNAPPPHFVRPLSPGEISLAPRSIWKSGWYGIENNRRNYFRWASGNAEMEIVSNESESFQAVLRFRTRAVVPMDLEIWNGGVFVGRFESHSELGKDLEAIFTIHPGINVISFRPGETMVSTPRDARPLSFLLYNPTLKQKSR